MLVEGFLLALVFIVNGVVPEVCVTQALGYHSPYLVSHGYFIKPAQRTALAILLPDPKCTNNQTLGLSVKVCDDKVPEIKISKDKVSATIIRTGHRKGTAYVIVNIHCAVDPHTGYLPYVYGETNNIRSNPDF